MKRELDKGRRTARIIESVGNAVLNCCMSVGKERRSISDVDEDAAAAILGGVERIAFARAHAF